MTEAPRESGAKRIFFYNWPIYVLAWIGGPLVAAVAWWVLGPPVSTLVALGATVGVVWSAVSLAISFYIYDRSVLSGGTWVPGLLQTGVESWISVDAGLDAEVELDAVMPGKNLARLDIFDLAHMPAGSIQRARERTQRAHEAKRVTPVDLQTASDSCDAIIVPFSAHEVHEPAARETFFRELWRTLRAGGRVVLVEHLRDAANFAVYGPGAFHFRARSEWLRLAEVAQFRVADERRITPFVMALVLEKSK